MIVSYRRNKEETPETKPKKKTKLYKDRAAMEAFKAQFIREHNSKFEANRK